MTKTLFAFFLTGTLGLSLSVRAASANFDDELGFLQNLEKNLNSTDEAVINQHLQHVEAIEASPSLSVDERTQIYLIESGYLGLLAKKKHSGKLGKDAFEKLEAALKLSPSNITVVMAYAESVGSMNASSSIAKAFIQKSLSINLNECKEIAIAHLRQLSVKPGTPDYLRVQGSIADLEANRGLKEE